MTSQGTTPCISPISAHLRELHRELAGIQDGEVATYIPELAKANPDWFGIAVVTTNGGVYEVGDSRQPFTIQSISKPFVYGLALEDHGREAVLAKVGVEPTGDAFNSISLDPVTGRPRNPMINAGAIASTGLVSGKTPAIALKRILEMFGRYTGRELAIDGAVYGSESVTGHRNRAIGHMLRNFDILSGDPMPVVETYFQQCSILGHCLDLAIMAATLANRGINPLTYQQAIRGEYVESVLGVMGTCGMYDYAGEWLYEVGMPAKSGVAGGIVAVLPGQLGIGVFSPRLDSHGNSVRGIRACSALSRAWDLHLYNRPGVGNSIVRHRLNAADFNSSRVRSVRERAALSQHGGCILLFQLQGNLVFATAELIVRELTAAPTLPESLILDFHYVLSINESACTLFHDVLLQLTNAGCIVLFSGLPANSHLRRVMKAKLGPRIDELFRTFDESDIALQWCEDRLLDRLLPALPEMSIGADHYELLQGFNAEELAVIRKMFERRTWQAGETIFSAGDPARDLYLLARGTVSVHLPIDHGRTKRLAVFTAGMAFGEMAILDRAPRSATIIADAETACDLLSFPKLTALGFNHPKLKIKLLESIALGLCAKLRKANRETVLLA
jgi:glutaminase